MNAMPTRRVLGALLSLALMLAMIPALPVFAATGATASLTQGASYFPGLDRAFSVRVANPGGITGDTINYVSVLLPKGSAGVALNSADASKYSAPSGWQVDEVLAMGNLHLISYEASGVLGGLRGGSAATFTFPATVNRPRNSELSGVFRVDVSTDGGQTLEAAAPTTEGALTTTVKVLELVGVPTPTSDKHTDRTATAGQSVSFVQKAKNHARDALALSATLTASKDVTPAPDEKYSASATLTGAGADLAQAPTEQSIAFADIPLTAKKRPVDADQTVTWTGQYSSGSKVLASAVSQAFTVQAASAVVLSDFQPRYTQATRDVALPVRREISIASSRDGTPSISKVEGSLSFAATSAKLASGAAVGQRLQFEDPNSAGQLAEIKGQDGDYTATVALNVTDDNGYAYVPNLTLPQSGLQVTIDTLAPDLLIDVDLDPNDEGRTATKDGASFAIEIVVPGPQAALDAELDKDSVVARLLPNGEPASEAAKNAGFQEQVTFGDPVFRQDTDADTPGDQPGYVYATTVSRDWPGEGADTKYFAVSGSLTDLAGNGNSATLGLDKSLNVDNVLPDLVDPGKTGYDAAGNSIIEIRFEDAHVGNDVRGGCDPRLYRIDGVPGRVASVRFDDGSTESCLGKENLTGSGRRILVLDYDLDQDETPSVNYLLRDAASARSLGLDPVNDGALNDALSKTISTVVGIAPAAPELLQVFRNEGAEEAYAEDATYQGADVQKYWTRIGGGLGDIDGTSSNPGDLEVTFAGSRDGYTIQVLAEDATTVLREKSVSGRNQFNPQDEGIRKVLIPLPNMPDCQEGTSTHCEYVRHLRFLPAASGDGEAARPAGEIVTIIVALDQVLPALGTVGAPDANGNVAVDFTELIVAGDDRAVDWYGYETLTNDDGESYESYYRARQVSFTDGDSRSIEFLPGTFTNYQTTLYLKSADSLRYEDRAGNTVADSNVPA